MAVNILSLGTFLLLDKSLTLGDRKRQWTELVIQITQIDTDSQIKLMQYVLLNILQWYRSFPSAQGHLAITCSENRSYLKSWYNTNSVVFFVQYLLFMDPSSMDVFVHRQQNNSVVRCASISLSVSVGIYNLVSDKAWYERSLSSVIRAGPYQCHGQTGSLTHSTHAGTQGQL